MNDINHELIKLLKNLKFTTFIKSSRKLIGQYRSIFKGNGIEFSHLKSYEYGEDLKKIDWKTTAKLNKPYIKTFHEERSLNILLLVDKSLSMSSGNKNYNKSELIKKLSIALSYLAISNNDSVSLITFSDDVEDYLPPQSSLKQLFNISKALDNHQNTQLSSNKSSLSKALQFALTLKYTSSIIFILSDFIVDNYTFTYKALRKNNEIHAFCTCDTMENEISNLGLIEIYDNESNEKIIFDTNNKKNFTLEKEHKNFIKNNKTIFSKHHNEFVEIYNNQNPIQILEDYFLSQKQKL